MSLKGVATAARRGQIVHTVYESSPMPDSVSQLRTDLLARESQP